MKNFLSNESLGEKLVKKSFWLYLFSYIALPSAYLTRIIISNSVSVADVGVLYSIIGFMSIISIYNDLGLTESLQYFLPKYRIQKKYNYTKTIVFFSLFVQLITAIGIIIFLWYAAPRLAENYFHSENVIVILRLFCVYFLGKNAYEVVNTIFVSFQDTFNSKLSELIKSRSIFLFTSLFFILGYASIVYYALAWIASMFIALLIAYFAFRKNYQQLLIRGNIVRKKKILYNYSKYALWVFIGINAASLLSYFDQQMVIIFFNAEYAGYYANYLSLFFACSTLIGPIVGLILPLVRELITKQQTANIIKLQNVIFTYITVVSCSLAGLLSSLGPEIATVLFGQKFIMSGQLLVVGAGVSVLNILVGIALSILTGMGGIQQRVKLISSVGIANIIMNYFFLQIRGLYGIIFSTAIGLIIMLTYTLYHINRKYKIIITWHKIYKNLILIGVIGYMIYIIKDYIFVINDAFRMTNFWKLVIIGLLYYTVLGIYNFQEIKIIKKELLSMKKSL